MASRRLTGELRAASTLAGEVEDAAETAKAEAETAAQVATERMSLPVVLLFAGFLCFVAFPAIERVLAGL